MGGPPGNRPAVPRGWIRGVPERYVAGADTRGRQEGWPYPWLQQVIHKISGLGLSTVQRLEINCRARSKSQEGYSIPCHGDEVFYP